MEIHTLMTTFTIESIVDDDEEGFTSYTLTISDTHSTVS